MKAITTIKHVLFSKTFTWVAFIGVCIVHLLSLQFSPLPWFDEVLFADVVQHLKQGLGLRTAVTPFYLGDIPVNLYGPVYFYCQAAVTQLLGTTALSFRLLNLASALLLVYVLRNRVLAANKRSAIFVWLIILFSPLFAQNSHSGRMDLFAVLFVFFAYVLLFKNDLLNAQKVLSVSILLCLAILTTPRVMFLTPGLAVFFLPHLLHASARAKAVLLGLTLFLMPVLVYCLWSYTSTGGFLTLIQEMLFSPKNQPFLGSGFFRKKLEDALFLLFIVYYLVAKWKHRRFTDLSSALALGVVIFQALVKEVGPYGAMQVPFEILGLIELTKEEQLGVKWHKGFAYVSMLLALGFAMIFLYKHLAILTHVEERSTGNVAMLLDKHAVSHKKVLSAFPYYYELLNRDNRVYNYEEALSENVEDAMPILNNLDPDYLLVLKNDTANFLVAELSRSGRFTLLDSIHISKQQHTGLYASIKQKLSNKVGYNSYEGYLYQRAD